MIRSDMPASRRLTSLLMLLAVVPTAACAQQIDTTVAARPNARVEIQNFAGTVVVRTWDRPAVRIVSPQGRRDEVRIRGVDALITIASIGRSGVPARRDYEITVPARASLDIGGVYTAIDIQGARGSVSATTVQGDVTLLGGDGVISLKSVEGTVTLRDANGRVELNGVNKGLVLTNVDGDIAAETVNGSILMDEVRSSDVEAVTVNGRVTYNGTIRDRGRYRFGTHNGGITVTIPEAANATIAAVTYLGTFSSRFALPRGVDSEPSTPRRRVTFALGDGSARIEAESFQGNIVLTRP
jgi:hypothetical protein